MITVTDDQDIMAGGLMTCREACQFLKVSTSTLYELMSVGKLTFVMLPGLKSRRIPLQVLVEYAKAGLTPHVTEETVPCA